MTTKNMQAPEGHLWVCAACGKTSTWLYGCNAEGKQTEADGTHVATAGWDESCVMNAHLIARDDVEEWAGARVIRLKPHAPSKHYSEVP